MRDRLVDREHPGGGPHDLVRLGHARLGEDAVVVRRELAPDDRLAHHALQVGRLDGLRPGSRNTPSSPTADMAPSMSAYAVIKMTGVVGHAARTRLSTSCPLVSSARWMSLSTTSYRASLPSPRHLVRPSRARRRGTPRFADARQQASCQRLVVLEEQDLSAGGRLGRAFVALAHSGSLSVHRPPPAAVPWGQTDGRSTAREAHPTRGNVSRSNPSPCLHSRRACPAFGASGRFGGGYSRGDA